MDNMQNEIAKHSAAIEGYTASNIDGKKKFSVLTKQVNKLQDEQKNLKDGQARVCIFFIFSYNVSYLSWPLQMKTIKKFHLLHPENL